LLSLLSCCTASESGASPAAGLECDVVDIGRRTCGCRSDRQRLKSGEGKTVRALTRMFVMISSLARWGLNWYLHVLLVRSRGES
jgi:hypothetical protein